MNETSTDQVQCIVFHIDFLARLNRQGYNRSIWTTGLNSCRQQNYTCGYFMSSAETIADDIIRALQSLVRRGFCPSVVIGVGQDGVDVLALPIGNLSQDSVKTIVSRAILGDLDLTPENEQSSPNGEDNQRDVADQASRTKKKASGKNSRNRKKQG